MTEVAHHYRLLSTGPLPVWLGVVLVCAALVVAVWLLNREYQGRRGKARSRWLYVIRAAVVTCLALLVIQPVLFIRRDETKPAFLLLAVDRSRSMLRTDPYDTSSLLNLAAATGASNFRDREDLPERIRTELLGWQKELLKSQTQAASMRDDLSQGTPPGSAFERSSRDVGQELQAMTQKLRSQCDELAKLQSRTKFDATATNSIQTTVTQWFAAPTQALDQLSKLGEKLQSTGTGEWTEEKAVYLLRAHEDALAALKLAAESLSSLQGYCDAQTEKSLTDKQRAEVQRLNAESRFALATRVVSAMVNKPELAARHTVQLLDSSPLDANNAEDHTDLFEDVKRAIASAGQKTIAGVVFVSDGQQNLPARPEIMRELASRGIPFITAGVGLPETLPDVAIRNYGLPTTLLAGSRATVWAELKTAVPTNTEVTLSLSLNGNALAEKHWKPDGPVARVALEFAVPSAVNAPLVLAAKTPQPDGAPNNDQVEIGVTVLAEQARVLIVAPSARWDIVYLMKALARKPWRLDTVFWGKEEGDDGDKVDISKQLAQLKNYQFVVLDGKPFKGMTDADSNLLRNYVVKDGGCLLMIASDASGWYGDKLGSLLGAPPPQSPSENSAHLEPAAEALNYPIISLAADGAESVALWRQLAVPQQVRPVPPQSLPMLTFRQQPLLSLGFHGRGKTYALGCGDLFRVREWGGAAALDRFFSNLIDDALRSVFPNPSAKLAAYPPMPVAGSIAHILVDADVAKGAPTGQATPESQPATALQFQRSAGDGNLSEAHLRIGKWPQYTFDVPGHEKLVVRPLASVSLEDVYFGLDSDRLRSLAELANGTYVPLPDIPNQIATIPSKKDVTTTMRVIRLWNLWFLLPLLVALMTADWVLRRRTGLVL